MKNLLFRISILFIAFLFTQQVISQQVNNDCASAKSLTPGSTCGSVGATLSSESLYLATATGSPTSSCGTTYDNWYYFTVPSGISAVTITLTPGANPNSISNTNTFIEVFNASTCGGISTSNSRGCNGSGSAITVTGLTPDSLYYFRVFTNTNPTTSISRWAYSLCVTYITPPSNDECSGATTLNSGVANNSGTVWAATASTGITTGCATGDPDDDVWYKFTTTGTNLTVTLSGVGADLTTSGARLQLFSGSCGSLSSVACGTNTLSTSVTNATTYYIRVYSFGTGAIGSTAAGSAFSITATTTPPPTNDDCSGSTALTSGVANNSGTVWGATASSSIPVGCATGDPDDDVWYSIAATGVNMSVSLSAIGTNLSSSGAMLQLFSGSCGTLTSIACGNTNLSATVTNGTTYYIRVYSAGTGSIGGISSGSAFTITATTSSPPANDDCANATLITSDSACVVGTSKLTGQTLASTTADGGTITSSCTAVNSPDVWYKFVAKTKNPTITVNNLGASWGTTLKIQLLSGSCGAFTEVGCTNYVAANTTLTPTVANSLTPGNTYYIRIHKNTTTAPGAGNWGFDICVSDPLTKSSRMNEVFARTILSGSNALQYPWEITYGPDNNLWITESRGYKLYKMDPNTGVKTTVLDLSSGSTWLTAPADSLNAQSTSTWTPWPQGGFAGMALHPKFLDGSGTADYVYVAYIHRFLGGSSPTGIFYRNKLVRFTYNTGTSRLESPVVLCDTLPGSNDHNSQRMIIAPITPGGTNYLFYAEGDMGAGQFNNRDRPIKSQNPNSYEGKILRFNLVSDGDAGGDAWIPNDNPYSSSSAVYNIGIRNNQGFAYDTALNILYGSSHGPYSDDEINIIEPFRNYGHPLVIGYASDGNYNGTTTPSTSTSVTAGAPFTVNSGNSTCPPIGDEVNNKTTIDGNGNGLYKDPLFSAYASSNATIQTTWSTNPPNSGWASEGWSGMDFYSNKLIPGWKRSLLAAGLKWGRMLRLKLGASGNITLPSNHPINNQGDTITYFQSVNRYRDLAFAPNGKEMFLVMDNTSATSGPGTNNPVAPACPGCVIKYTFLGYADNAGLSNIPKSIDVTDGTVNTCNTGTTVTIDASNNFLWVPITGPDGNIMAEINANGNVLGTVTSSFYKKASGSIRSAFGVRYLDRNITITPQFQPSTPVKIRLYISKSEFDDLDNDPLSGLTGTGNVNLLKILKNNDPCSPAMSSAASLVTPTNTLLADLTQGTSGYVLQATITGFSSFYFAASAGSLPLDLITFTGSLQNNNSTLLKWKTENEINTSHFTIERSADGRTYTAIGKVDAKGGLYGSGTHNYEFIDDNVLNQTAPVLYYRLKISDLDGQFKYSNVVQIKLPDITKYLRVHPNPASNELKADIVVTEQDEVTIQVINITGQVILQKTARILKGRNQIPVNISTLSKGTYYLHISGSNIEQKVKFQKM